MKPIYTTALACAALGSAIQFTGPAMANSSIDWIESVESSKNGIDAIPVEVLAKDDTYKELKSKAHRFLLEGHVKAKRRKEIARVTWQSKENPHFASGPNTPSWEKRALIRRGLRETTLEGNRVIDLDRITWIESPQEACEDLKTQKMNAGLSQEEVLGKAWTTNAKAMFFIKADVIRRKTTMTDTNYDTESAMLPYQVSVRCLAQPFSPKPRKTAKTNGDNGGPPARAPRKPIE